MKSAEIMNWVVNALVFSLPLSWYMCYQMYKDLKKKDKIIEIQNRIINSYHEKTNQGTNEGGAR